MVINTKLVLLLSVNQILILLLVYRVYFRFTDDTLIIGLEAESQ